MILGKRRKGPCALGGPATAARRLLGIEEILGVNEHHQSSGIQTEPSSDERSGRLTHDCLFGSHRRPFEDRADATFTFITPELEETCAAVEYEIRYGQGAILVVGEAGLGKTQFVRTMLSRLSAKDHAVVLTWPASGKRDLTRETCKAFGISISATRGNDAGWLSRLERHLKRQKGPQCSNVLFIDQAENLSTNNLTQLSALTELESEGAKLLTVVLLAQPILKSVLKQPKHARLMQHLFGERHISPLTRPQTAEYIRHRLSVAAVADPELFESNAVDWIYERTRGVPRLINHLCRQAMLAAYGADESKVSLTTLASINEPGVAHERSMDIRSLGLPRDDADGGVPETATPEDAAHEMAEGSEAHRGYDDEQNACFHLSDSEEDAVCVETDDLEPATAYNAVGLMTDVKSDHALLGSMDSLFVRGEALLIRLERALARADRMSATAESNYTRNKAVETHLQALTERAQRVIDSLGKAAPQALKSLDAASKQIQAIESARAEGAKVEARLLTAAKTIAKKADDVQDRTARLMQGLTSGPAVEARLDDAASRAAEVNAQCDQRLEALSRATAEADERTNKLKETLSDEALTTLQQKIDTITQAGGQAAARIEQRLSRAQQTITDAGAQFDEFEATCRDRILETCQAAMQEQRAAFQRAMHEVAQATKRTIDGACERAAEFVSDSESRMGTLRTNFEASIRQSESNVTDCVTETESRIQELQSTAHAVLRESQEQLDQSADDARTRIDEMSAACAQKVEKAKMSAAAVETDVDGIHDRINAAQRSLEVMGERADYTTKRLEQAAQHGESTLDALREERGRIEQAQRMLNEVIARVDAAAQQAEDVREQVVQCEQLSDELSGRSDEANELLHKLNEAALSGQNIQKKIESALVQAGDLSRRIDSHNAAATTTLKELASATVQGRTTIETINAESDNVRELAARAQAQVEALAAADDERKQLSHRLGLIVQAAHKLDASLNRRLDHSCERLKSLSAVSERTDEQQKQLTQLLSDGEKMIEQARRVTGECDSTTREKTEAMERLIERLLSLMAAAETTAERIKSDVGRGEQTATSLEQYLAPAESAREELGDMTRRAKARVEELAAREQSAGSLVDRLGSFSESLESARELHDAVVPLVEEARTLCDELSAAGADARQQANELHELQQSSADWTQIQKAMNADSESIIHTLGEQLKTAQACAASSESVLVDFVNRVETIEKLIAELGARTVHVRETVSSLLAQPEQAVHEAKAQGEKLARVTDAVRKVSAGLAQTTLEAKQHLDALTEVNRDAAQRLSAVASLTGSTRRATESLRDWMEQSSRIQQHIDRIDEEPVPHEPTPAADRNTGKSRVVNQHAVGQRSGVGALTRLSSTTESKPQGSPANKTPAATGAERTPVGATARSTENAAEIARLIDQSR